MGVEHQPVMVGRLIHFLLESSLQGGPRAHRYKRGEKTLEMALHNGFAWGYFTPMSGVICPLLKASCLTSFWAHLVGNIGPHPITYPNYPGLRTLAEWDESNAMRCGKEKGLLFLFNLRQKQGWVRGGSMSINGCLIKWIAI